MASTESLDKCGIRPKTLEDQFARRQFSCPHYILHQMPPWIRSGLLKDLRYYNQDLCNHYRLKMLSDALLLHQAGTEGSCSACLGHDKWILRLRAYIGQQSVIRVALVQYPSQMHLRQSWLHSMQHCSDPWEQQGGLRSFNFHMSPIQVKKKIPALDFHHSQHHSPRR